MEKTIKIFFLSLPLVIFSGACFRDSECFDLRNDFITITFEKDKKTEESISVTEVWFEESDSAFASFDNPVNKLSLPLNPSKDKQKINFVFTESAGSSEKISRFIEVGYNVKTQFESTDCEPKFFFSTLSIENSSEEFLSVKVVDTLPKRETGGKVNIEVVY